MKKIGLLPFSSFKLVVSGSPIRTSCVSNLASGCFPCLNPAHVHASPQNVPNCRTVRELGPQRRRCWAHGGPCGHVPAHKKGSVCMVCGVTSAGHGVPEPFEKSVQNCVSCGHMGYAHRNRGLGLSPSPDPVPKYNIFKFKYILKHIYITRNNMCGCWLGGLCQKLCICGGGLGFDPHGLHKNFKHHNNNRVPRGSPCLGHVAPPICQKMPRVKT
jgi:hypothetical protein